MKSGTKDAAPDLPAACALAVIGGGPAGYPAAFYAADQGLDVVLIDPEPHPGGVCLYRGCIPSKTLLHAAALLGEAREAAAMGIAFDPPRIDLDRLRAWKQSVVTRLTGGLGQLSRARGIRCVRGRAAFKHGRTLVVEPAGGARAELAFDHALLATGSEPVRIPGLPDSPRVMDSTGALDLADIPRRLLVVGGGYIGLELGQVYAALGSEVSVVEMTPGLLPGADADLVRLLAGRVTAQFAAVMLETRVAGVAETGDGLRVDFEGKAAPAGGGLYDRVLVAVGRRPCTAGLGLENTRIETDARGFVRADAQRRTAEPSVFAAGDAAGQPMLAHKATHEGRVAVDAMLGRRAVFEPHAIPAVVFTDPELAWCGLGEAEAAAAGRKVSVTRFPWAASGRALSLGRTDGLTKLVLDPDSRRVLGAAVAGPGAGELIAEAVLAVEMGAVAEDLALTIHPHPTLSETVMEAAGLALGRCTHLAGKR